MSDWTNMIKRRAAKGGQIDRLDHLAFKNAKIDEVPRKLSGIRRARQNRAMRQFGEALLSTSVGRLFNRLTTRVFG